MRGAEGTRLSGRVAARPVWPPDPFAQPVTADIHADGSFRLGPLEPAEYAIEVNADGFAPHLCREAHPGERVDLTPRPGSTILGTVRTAEGVPIPRASVWGVFPAPYFGRRLTTADAEGRYRLTGMPPGRTRLIAEAERYGPALDVVEISLESSGIDRDVCRDVYLSRGTDLVGLLRSQETGDPLPGASVLAWTFPPEAPLDSSEDLLVARGRSLSDGTFKIPRLPAGRVSGWILAPGRSPACFDVPLSSDWRCERIDADLTASGRATVRFVSPSGKAEPDVEVEAVLKAPEGGETLEPPMFREMALALRRRADDTGLCTFEDLRTDRFAFFALARADGRVPRYSSESFWPLAGRLFASPDYRVERGRSALARVVLPDGSAAAFAHATMAGQHFLADKSGFVRIDGIAGTEAALELDHPGASPTISRLSLLVREDVETTGAKLMLGGGSSLSGRIARSGSGDALAGVDVVVSGSAPFPWARRALTGADGAFSIVGLGPAPFEVEVCAPGFEPVRERFTSSPAAPLTLSLARRSR